MCSSRSPSNDVKESQSHAALKAAVFHFPGEFQKWCYPIGLLHSIWVIWVFWLPHTQSSWSDWAQPHCFHLERHFFFLFLQTLFSLGSGGPVSRAYGVSWSIIPSKGLGYKRRGSFLLSPHLDLSGDCELVGCSWRGGGRGCLVTPSWVSWGSEVCVWINGRRRVSKESPT